jgi:hypothetical protein
MISEKIEYEDDYRIEMKKDSGYLIVERRYV